MEAAHNETNVEDKDDYEDNIANQASNHWVIHGNHTKNGKPLLASDPHLGTGVPSVWVI